MKETEDWSAPGILFVSVVLFVLCFGVIISGNEKVVQEVFLFAGPLFPILAGMYGLRQFSEGGLIGRDQFTTMNIFFALGTIVLSLSEITTSIVTMIPEQRHYFFMVFLLQFPGILIWGIGGGSYFYGTVKILKWRNPKKLLVMLSLIAILLIVLFVGLQFLELSDRSLIDMVAHLPAMMILLGNCLAFGILCWIFRGGRFVLHQALLFTGSFLVLVGSIMWSTFGVPPINPLMRLLTLEAYLVIAAALRFGTTL